MEKVSAVQNGNGDGSQTNKGAAAGAASYVARFAPTVHTISGSFVARTQTIEQGHTR